MGRRGSRTPGGRGCLSTRARPFGRTCNDEITVDALPSAAGHSWDELRGHIVEVEIDDVRVKVLDLPGLLKTKEVPRPKDQADAEATRHALELLQRK